jgi:hypothetical protein
MISWISHFVMPIAYQMWYLAWYSSFISRSSNYPLNIGSHLGQQHWPHWSQWGKRKYLLAQTKKINEKECFIKNHNLCDKFFFKIFFILWSTLIFVLCLKNIFIQPLPNSLQAFTFAPSCLFYIHFYILFK